MTPTILGKGAYGTVYQHGPYALKVTCLPEEYHAAITLIQQPRPWACAIYSAEQKSETEFHIVKEKVTPFLSGEYQNRYPGHFHGIIHQEGDYKGIATRPLEFNGLPFDYNNNQPFNIIPFTAQQVNFLAGLYSQWPMQQQCFTWFVKTYWQVKKEGFFTADLWSNIGTTHDGKFVIFDVMYPDKDEVQ